MIFQLPCHQKRWLCHYFAANLHMTLLHESYCFLHRLGKFQRAQYNCQSAPAEGGDGYLLSCLDVVFGVDESHRLQFLKQLFSSLNTEGVVEWQLLDLANEAGDEATNFIVVGVVLSVLQMVAMHDFGFSLVSLDLPVVEVDLFQ